MHVLIIGCGYLGRRAAQLWTEAGSSVTALTRSADNATELRTRGVTPVMGDVMDRKSLTALPSADVLLYAVGHDRTAENSKRDVYVDGLRIVLNEITPRTRRLIYISSVSVYGQSDGTWVDESSPCEPTSEGGRICLDAEAVFRNQTAESHPGRSHILRLAGIYGPGRLIARTEQLRNRQPLSGDPEAWLNLIHVEDAARCAVACASAATAANLYVVSDDRPVTRREFYSAVCRLIGAPPPEFDPEAQGRQRSSGLNKRCCSTRMKSDLLPELNYPKISHGLSHAIAGQSTR